MGRRWAGWCPPHCPNPNCEYFKGFSGDWPVKRKGFYLRATRPCRIQRFTCRHCGRHFSTQTFSTTYWQKRPELTGQMYMLVVGCMGNRQIARALGCSPSTVTGQIARLGRHCLLFQATEVARIPPLREVTIDGFETFEYSQYFPFHHNLAVDVASSYLIWHTDSPLRRKGRMTSAQKKRREHLEQMLGRAHPRAVEAGVRDLLEVIAAHGRNLTIRSDEHRDYPRAIASLPSPVAHRVTSSKQRRDERNPLWEVNVLDLLIRHSTAAHKRETIAWAKRRQASIDKLTILQVWRNYIKRRTEKGGRVTPAMLLGLANRPLRAKDILARRIFFQKVVLPDRWECYYRRLVRTRALPVNRTHRLTYAF